MGGAVHRRKNSEFWQVRYKDQKGAIVRESAGTSERQEAERFLRDRLDARDDGEHTEGELNDFMHSFEHKSLSEGALKISEG